MDFALLPPEVNSAKMYAGPGSGPMLAAAAAWNGLAGDLQSTAASYQSAVSGLTSGPWLGPSSMSMAAAAMPYVSWLSTAAAQAAQAASQAKMAASAYEAAFAMTVPPPMIVANRSLLMSLIATNFLGQNTAAIAATEAQYMEMWAQDAAAMYGYAGQSATASTLTPIAPAPNTTNAAGLTGQGGALAQAAATSAGTGAHTIASTSPLLLSAVPTVLQGLAQPSQSTSGLSAILDALGFNSVQSYFTLGNAAVPYTVSATTVNMAINATHFAQWPAAGAGELAGASSAPIGELGSGAGTLVSAGPGGLSGSAVTASTGQASVVGRMSVPPGWAVAPEIRLVASVLPMASASAAPAVLTGSSGTLFSEMALAGMAGRAMGGGIGRQQDPEAASPQRVGLPQQALGGPITSIAAELQKLAELRDSKVLTDDEFHQLKQRLLAR
jgi:PPE-repeat protein